MSLGSYLGRVDGVPVHAFEVLGDPVRRRVLELLAEGERPAGEIAAVLHEEFGISQPAASQHLRVLRENGFARVRAEGRRRLYAVDAAPLRELEHSVPIEFAGSGAGGLSVGPGWDVAVLALALFLRGEVVEDPVVWENTLAGQRFSERSIAAWAAVITTGGTATDDEVAAATEAARAQFTPDLVPGTSDD